MGRIAAESDQINGEETNENTGETIVTVDLHLNGIGENKSKIMYTCPIAKK